MVSRTFATPPVSPPEVLVNSKDMRFLEHLTKSDASLLSEEIGVNKAFSIGELSFDQESKRWVGRAVIDLEMGEYLRIKSDESANGRFVISELTGRPQLSSPLHEAVVISLVPGEYEFKIWLEEQVSSVTVMQQRYPSVGSVVLDRSYSGALMREILGTGGVFVTSNYDKAGVLGLEGIREFTVKGAGGGYNASLEGKDFKAYAVSKEGDYTSLHRPIETFILRDLDEGLKEGEELGMVIGAQVGEGYLILIAPSSYELTIGSWEKSLEVDLGGLEAGISNTPILEKVGIGVLLILGFLVLTLGLSRWANGKGRSKFRSTYWKNGDNLPGVILINILILGTLFSFLRSFNISRTDGIVQQLLTSLNLWLLDKGVDNVVEVLKALLIWGSVLELLLILIIPLDKFVDALKARVYRFWQNTPLVVFSAFMIFTTVTMLYKELAQPRIVLLDRESVSQGVRAFGEVSSGLDGLRELDFSDGAELYLGSKSPSKPFSVLLDSQVLEEGDWESKVHGDFIYYYQQEDKPTDTISLARDMEWSYVCLLAQDLDNTRQTMILPGLRSDVDSVAENKEYSLGVLAPIDIYFPLDTLGEFEITVNLKSLNRELGQDSAQIYLVGPSGELATSMEVIEIGGLYRGGSSSGTYVLDFIATKKGVYTLSIINNLGSTCGSFRESTQEIMVSGVSVPSDKMVFRPIDNLLATDLSGTWYSSTTEPFVTHAGSNSPIVIYDNDVDGSTVKRELVKGDAIYSWYDLYTTERESYFYPFIQQITPVTDSSKFVVTRDLPSMLQYLNNYEMGIYSVDSVPEREILIVQ